MEEPDSSEDRNAACCVTEAVIRVVSAGCYVCDHVYILVDLEMQEIVCCSPEFCRGTAYGFLLESSLQEGKGQRRGGIKGCDYNARAIHDTTVSEISTSHSLTLTIS